jgi:hypothetical protein
MVATVLVSAGAAAAATKGYWRFEEGSAGQHPSTTDNEIIDSQGTGNHGTARETNYLTYAAGVHQHVDGQLAMDYGGSDNSQRIFVLDNSSLDITNAITLEAMVYPTSHSDANNIVRKWTTGVNESYVLRLTSAGNVRFILNDGSTTTEFSSSGTVPLNEWTHVAATWSTNDNTMRIYLNQQQDATTTSFTGPINSGTANLYLGSADGITTPFKGRLDEVRLCDAALDPDHFVYNPPKGTLVAIR